MKKTTLRNLIGVGFVVAMFFVIACKKNTDKQQITAPVEQENVLAGKGISDAISNMGTYNDSLIKASK